jgi:hypothetical protein
MMHTLEVRLAADRAAVSATGTRVHRPAPCSSLAGRRLFTCSQFPLDAPALFPPLLR